MNWGAFDLNLLIVFDAVMQERNVTRAGSKIGLSQPAVSHALSRLRYMLKDELFIRTPDGMAPTPRAEQLAGPLRRALSDMQLTLEPETFVPQEATRLFVLALNNYAAVILAPSLVTAVISTAPGIRLDLRPTGLQDMPALLDRGELDLAIGTFEDVGERFAVAPLLEDSFVVAMRRDHPAAQRELTEEALAGLSYLEISSSGEDSSFVDRWLGTRSQVRNIATAPPVSLPRPSSPAPIWWRCSAAASPSIGCGPTAFRSAGFPLHRLLSAPRCFGIAGSMISPLISGCASLSNRPPRSNKL
jgi:DNA-binding transcriptional LysR family regulator